MNATAARHGGALTIALAALIQAPAARAELGGTMSAAPSAHSAAQSVSATAAAVQAMQATQVTQTASPTMRVNGAVQVRATTDAGGTTIDEYASADGRIFAYTWEGPTMLDLRNLLGPYYDAYRAGTDASRADLRSLHANRVARDGVIVEAGGQMRSYVGRAWLPAALPPGVTPDDLQ
ncbi:DUF2844 domain-containing protein [Paraburkholderia sp.]|uniref:DUF2844 domain-containing protein n=1 Tax=Paraburkholderia sp. TaxID=1926495 RepID=UPI0023A6AA3F|nr:DUF2844 domain-containing protein [Paraburkholderia sp.]MDE1183851.1 DUF2844 domain-containing protein [Paraburkholderia sp.]